MEDVYVTLDIDWAPDPAIEATASILEGAGCRATWFVTHETPMLDRLRRRSDLFELGIHPNFLPGSSHGGDPGEVLRHVLAIAPEARVVRSHAAAQSGPILKALLAVPELELDCSVMLPGLRHVEAVAYGNEERSIWRISNFWSDDYEAEMRSPNWDLDERLDAPGAKVLIFHPIHVALNTTRMEAYAELRREEPDVAAWETGLIKAHRRAGAGAATLFERIAAGLGEDGGGAPLRALVPERTA